MRRGPSTRRGHAAARLAGSALLGVVSAALALSAGALGLARTSFGTGLLLERALLPQVNAAIAGKLEAGALEWRGRGRVALHDVVLRDPEGQPVLSVARVEATVLVGRLFRREVALASLLVERPELSLREDDAGHGNVARALAARRPESAKRARSATPTSPPWAVVVRDARLEHGAVRLAGKAGAPPRLLIEELGVTASGRWHAPAAGQLSASLAVHARLRAPVTGSLRARADAAGSLAEGVPDLRGEAELELGESGLALDVAVTPPAAGATLPDATVTLARLRVAPALTRELVPAWDLPRPITGTGEASLAGATGAAKARLALAAGGGDIVATVDTTARSSARFEVRARALDLSALHAPLPASRLTLDLRANGRAVAGGWQGVADLEIARGLLGGLPMGPVRARVEASPGRYRLAALDAELPGATLTARGQVAGARLNGQLGIALRDLGATLAGLGLPDGARTAGRGRIRLALAGSTAAPALDASGTLRGLRHGGVEVPELRFAFSLPDVRRPLAGRGKLLAPRARVGERRLAGLTGRWHDTGRRLDASLALAEPPLALQAGGAWRERGESLRLDRVRLRLDRASFRLQKSTSLVARTGHLEIDGLSLVGDRGQALRLAIDKRPARLDARVETTDLLLERLPAYLVPRAAGLAGRLTATVRVRQRRQDTSVEGRLALAEGRVGELGGIALAAHGNLADGRVAGDLELTTAAGQTKARLTLPAKWPLPATAPLDADLELGHLDLARLAAALESLAGRRSAALAAARVAGMATGQLRLRGTARAPRAALELALRGLAFRGASLGDAELSANALEGDTTRVRLRLADSAGTPGLGRGEVDLEMHASLAELLRGPGQLERTRLALEARLDALDLQKLADLTGQPRRLGGTASLTAQADGTWVAPRGRLALALAGVTTDGVPPTDGQLDARVDERGATVEATVQRRGATLLAANARLAGPLASWRSPASLGARDLRVHARVGPLAFQHDGLGPGPAGRQLLRGSARAELLLTGTARAPRLHATAHVERLRLDEQPVGEAQLELSYAAGDLRGEARLVSANGSELRARASLAAELGYPGRTGLAELRAAPFSARLEASGYELAALAGAVPRLRALSGRLDGDLRVDGSLADPQPSGRFAFRDGGVTVSGLGEYRDVELVVAGSREQVTLEKLAARSGAGRARMTATATRRPDSGYDLAGSVDTDKLPVYVEGQALADLSVEAKLKGSVARGRVRGRIALASVRLALKDAKRKRLPKLALPDDIILVEDGDPIDEAEARRLAALEAAEATGREASEAAAPPPELEPGIALELDGGNNLWLSGKDANVELGLEPGFRVEAGSPARVYGRVLIRRGRVDVVGRRFDLAPGSSLRFSGPVAAPALDVTATHRNETENITVAATVAGAPGNLRTRLTSPGRPDLTESQLYTLVVTGRLSLAGGTASPITPAERAETIVGGLVAGQLQKLVAKKLPLDVLTIEGGLSTGSTRLEAGKYVTSDLYVGYVGRTAADPMLLQNRNAVHLEYALGTRWSFEGEYGDAKTGSADIIWTKRY